MDKIESIYVSYEDIVDKFPKDVIDQRYDFLLKEINLFIETYTSQNLAKLCLRVNEYSLLHAVLDYFSDIARLKEFHSIEKANEYKVFAYELHWILKRKPIQVLTDGDANEELVFINEKFALTYALAFLMQDIDVTQLAEQSQNIINSFIESFYYYLKYRTYTPQDLEMVFLSYKAGLSTNIQ